MNTKSWKVGLAASLTVGLAVMTGTAYSAQPDAGAPAPSVTVRYGDLDLTRDEGVKTLYLRLRAAAREVCSDDGTREIARRVAARHCYEDALDRAVAGVRNKHLAALHSREDRRLRSSAS